MNDTPTNNREHRKILLGWVPATVITLGVAALVAGTSLDMWTLNIFVTAGSLLSILLLWIVTSRRSHRLYKSLGTCVVLILAAFLFWWIYTNDRPILKPEFGIVITKSLSGNGFALAAEALIKNSGKQPGYANRFDLVMNVDGAESHGREIFAQTLPANAANEQQLFDQDFPPGKPVRGWLFFVFPGMSHDIMLPYFTCNSELLNRVTLKLSVWDSKRNHEWTDTKRLKELGDESCTPAQLAMNPTTHSSNPSSKPILAVPHLSKPEVPKQYEGAAPVNAPPISPTPSSAFTAPPASGQSMLCTGSNCVLGPNFGNQFLVQNPGRGLNDNQFLLLVSDLKKLHHGTAVLVLHQPIDAEMNRFGGQLQAAFTQAGWSLPGAAIDISNSHRMISYGAGQATRNSPEGLHCVSDNSKLGNDLLNLLMANGVHCSVSSSELYPPPNPQPNLTIFMGRNLE